MTFPFSAKVIFVPPAVSTLEREKVPFSEFVATSFTVTETFEVDGVLTEIYCQTINAESSYTIFKIDDGPKFALPKKSSGYYPAAIGKGQHTIQVTGQGSAKITYQEKYI